MQASLDLTPWTAEQLAELRDLQQQEAAIVARRAVLLTEMSARCDAASQAAGPSVGGGRLAPWASMVLDAAGVLRLHQGSVSSMVDDARQLTLKLPRTLAALASGELHVGQAKRLMSVTASASAAVCAELEEQLLPSLADLPPAQVERLAKAAVLQADPELAATDHQQAVADRRVRVRPLPDGMSEISATTDAVTARQWQIGVEDLEERARQEQTSTLGIPLSQLGRRSHRKVDLMTQLPDLVAELLDLIDGVLPSLDEASLFERWFPATHLRAMSDLLRGQREPGDTGPSDGTATGTGTGSASSPTAGSGSASGSSSGSGSGSGSGGRRRRISRRRGRKRQVRIDVPAVTCVRGMGGVGWVEGYGPIAASQALALLPTAELRRGLVDPDTGRLLALDRPGQVPDLSDALEQARQALHTEREMQRAWTRESFAAEHRWDGRTERRRTPRPPRSDTERAAEAEAVELLLAWRAAQQPPTVDPDQLSDLDRQLLALALADRDLPPDDPSRRVEPQHDPSPDLVELVTLRDETCDGPGCAMPSTRSDLDHHHRYQPDRTIDGDPAGLGGTRTSAASLTPRSERCHAAKHHPHWTVIGHGDGTSTWTSPTGQQIRTRSSVRGLLPRPKPRQS